MVNGPSVFELLRFDCTCINDLLNSMNRSISKPTIRCAPSKNLDPPVHSLSLSRIFTGCILDSQGHKVFYADKDDCSD